MVFTVGSAEAAQNLRIQVDQKGDFVLFGNTLGYECDPAAMTPMPIVGNVGACGDPESLADTSPDILWRSDSPMEGQAEASTAITPAQARSTAVLQIPAGASITHAFLYWGAKGTMASDNTVMLERPGAGGFAATTVMAKPGDVYTQTANRYHAVADVTTLVQANGPGAYRLSDLNIQNLANLDDSSAVAGWWMVVFYQLATDPPRNLALFDGFDLVTNGNSQNVTISGFQVPGGAGFDAKLGVATYEADNLLTGDQLFFYTGLVPDLVPLSDALNPANNFFNSTRSYLGAPVTVVGDLPQLTGTPQSLSGIDLDVIDVEGKLKAGDTSATIRATSSNETYQLAMFVTSISTFKPDFSASSKTAKDVNGNKLTPGDEIEYTIVAANTGNDASVNTVMTDKLPPQVTYVPGSIAITAGANAGAKTDAPADDQATFLQATNTITVRLGAGANDLQGGKMAVGESTTVTFRVKLNADVTGTIANQAVITAEGEQGAPEEDMPTDGNGNGMGQPPTEVVVGQITPTADMDGDGLSDDDEILVGTDPNDADSDDDGVPDGQETNPTDDTDGDGKINALDPDSDGDGLFDGTELGKDCSNPATDPAANACIPDGDIGATKTNPVNADTDGGGLSDGDEDLDKDGVYDASQGEKNPNDKNDDVTICLCVSDLACGIENDGIVCESCICTPGCRGDDGSGCPEGSVCTSADERFGECVPAGSPSGGTGGADTILYDGCICGVHSGSDDQTTALSLLGAAGIAAAWRRRRRRAAPSGR